MFFMRFLSNEERINMSAGEGEEENSNVRIK